MRPYAIILRAVAESTAAGGTKTCRSPNADGPCDFATLAQGDWERLSFCALRLRVAARRAGFVAESMCPLAPNADGPCNFVQDDREDGPCDFAALAQGDRNRQTTVF